MEEEWRDIQGYEGKYQVSNLGNVKSLNYKRSKKHKNLSFITNIDGYHIVALSKNLKSTPFRVHRLVGQSFLGLNIKDSSIMVCHKNDVRNDNNVNNLFIGTSKENTADMVKKGRHGHMGKFGKDNPNSKKVIQMDLQGNVIETFFSTMDIQRKLSYSNSNISACCTGKIQTAFGFKWKYKH